MFCFFFNIYTCANYPGFCWDDHIYTYKEAFWWLKSKDNNESQYLICFFKKDCYHYQANYMQVKNNKFAWSVPLLLLAYHPSWMSPLRSHNFLYRWDGFVYILYDYMCDGSFWHDFLLKILKFYTALVCSMSYIFTNPFLIQKATGMYSATEVQSNGLKLFETHLDLCLNYIPDASWTCLGCGAKGVIVTAEKI